MTTENIRIIWTNSETKEEKEIFSFNTTLAGLWHFNQLIISEYKKATCYNPTKMDVHKLEDIENLKKSTVLIALAQNDWNKARTAEALGINRTTLQELIKRWGFDNQKNGMDRIIQHCIDRQFGEISRDLVKAEVQIITEKIINEKLSGKVTGGTSL